MATMLWAAQLESARDENGKEIPVDMETTIDIGTILQVILLFFELGVEC
jgi:hypothetical protein